MELPVFSLSWELILTIASGYAGYFIANVGMRDHHKTIDVTFTTLIFGFFGTAAYLSVGRTINSIWMATIAAFLVSSIAGGLWSKWGRSWLRELLRYLKVSQNDDLSRAFDTIATTSNVKYTQLSVRLNDGTWLMCSNLRKFKDEPNGPCVLSRNGDILMYVTHVKGNKEEDDWEIQEEVSDPNYGSEISCIPQSQISRIDLRRKRS